MSMVLTELAAKQLEILMDAVPHAIRIGVLWNLRRLLIYKS
jgi:hypothetical protein